jgi:hypothetical protein
MRRLVPEELITPLKLLGKYNWLRWTLADTTPPSIRFHLNVPADPAILKVPALNTLLSGLGTTLSPDTSLSSGSRKWSTLAICSAV